VNEKEIDVPDRAEQMVPVVERRCPQRRARVALASLLACAVSGCAPGPDALWDDPAVQRALSEYLTSPNDIPGKNPVLLSACTFPEKWPAFPGTPEDLSGSHTFDQCQFVGSSDGTGVGLGCASTLHLEQHGDRVTQTYEGATSTGEGVEGWITTSRASDGSLVGYMIFDNHATSATCTSDLIDMIALRDLPANLGGGYAVCALAIVKSRQGDCGNPDWSLSTAHWAK
jgi:hypothetical protein